MALLTAAGNGTAKTNYPVAAFPATDMQSLYPLSVWHWTRQPDTTSTIAPFALNDATNQGFDSYWSNNSAAGGMFYYIEQYASPADGFAKYSFAPQAGTWYGWGGTYGSASARTVVAPDGSAASDATVVSGSATLSNLRMAMVGLTTHAMAEFAAWNAELSAADFARLRQGANPASIRPDRLLWYFPLRNDVRDHGPLQLQVTGVGTWDKATAAYTDHPRVQLLRQRRLFGPARARRRPIFAYG